MKLHRKVSGSALVAALVFLPVCSRAGDPLVPDNEVKFLINPETFLNSEHKPTDEARRALGINGSPVRLQMELLDLPTQDLHKAGWHVRVRRREDKDHGELTYKRRYPFGDLAVKHVLAKAAGDGFVQGGHFEAQVDWSPSQKTLSLACDEKIDTPDASTLPDDRKARSKAVEKAPRELIKAFGAGFVERALAQAKIYGPISGKRWKGRVSEIDDSIDIEVWKFPGKEGVGDEILVEVSFKKQKEDKADAAREQMSEFLKQRNWLLPNGRLKETILLEGSKNGGL
jgi:hypothetical protein